MAAITVTNETTSLANSILQRFDANRDGSLSSNEFAQFLTQLIGNVATQPNLTAATTGSSNQTTLVPGVTPLATARVKVGNVPGFDPAKLADLTHDTFKYKMGRIFQYYPNTPEGLRQALPEIQAIVPGAKIVGTKGDKLDFGDYVDPKAGRIGIIDVIVRAGEGGTRWSWQVVK